MTEKTPDIDPHDPSIERRSFLKAAGVAAALPSIGGSKASASSLSTPAVSTATQATDSTYESVEIGPDRLTLGGQHIVGRDGYPTIADAWDAADHGDVVFVHSSYDAQSAGEEFPIVLNHQEKQVLLTGGDPSGSVIDAYHTDENVIEVIGAGMNDYRNMPMVQNLKIVGGNIGMRVRAAPYGSFKDLVFFNTGDHAVHVEGYTDPDSGLFKGTFGASFRNVQAWSCGGDGFRLSSSAHPHSTSFVACASMFNEGFGLMMRGYATRWIGGTIQGNTNSGIDARSGGSQLVQGVYFEGNGTAVESPMGVYVDGTAYGFTLDGCYFQGGYFRSPENGRSHGMWAVALFDDNGPVCPSISNCTFQNYDSFLYVSDTEDADIHLASHFSIDGSDLFQNGGGNVRLRSDGSVLPTDLSGGSPEGRFEGDYGVHDGSGDTPYGPAVWTGSSWVSAVNGESL